MHDSTRQSFSTTAPEPTQPPAASRQGVRRGASATLGRLATPFAIRSAVNAAEGKEAGLSSKLIRLALINTTAPELHAT